MEHRKTIYIIGAGVSGLIAALELENAGYSPVVIEKTAGVGGRVKTLPEQGMSLDLGFQVLLSAYPLANHYLDMDALRLKKLESGALIYAGGKQHRIGDPLRNWSILLPTLLANIGTLADKFRILKLNRMLKRKSIEEIFASREVSTRDYLRQFGFSQKIIDRFFRPFFAGIFLEPELRTSSRMFEFVYKMFGEGHATIPEKGIGAISEQLKSRLQRTTFRFNTAVERVTNETIVLATGEEIPHEGVIVATNADALIEGRSEQQLSWKSCLCLYFEVDRTNIPENTIGLVADPGRLSNNVYPFTDPTTGKRLLSVTSIESNGLTDEEMIASIEEEVKTYTAATAVRHIKSYRIVQALPDIANLRASLQPGENRAHDKVFVAGDSLLNGSLNAAMESGRLAALGFKKV